MCSPSDRMRLRRAAQERSTDPEPAGTYAVHSIGKLSDDSPAALALVDQLISIAPPRSPPGVAQERQSDAGSAS